MMRLKVYSAPAIEPVTVAQVKLSAHISHAVEDTLIEAWIKSGRELAEGYQRRAYITQTIDLSLDSWPCDPFFVPRSPLQTVTHIKYYDTDGTEYTVSAADYYVDTAGEPGRIGLTYGTTWPTTVLRPINGISVRFVAGYGLTAATVPQNVIDAILLYCTFRNENRAGEIQEIPASFYGLLRHDRIY